MKLLTGKCKEAFIDWYLKKGKYYRSEVLNNIKVKMFDNESLSMQIGVLEDFFDSVEIHLTCGKYGYSITSEDCTEHVKYPINSREKARIEAIEKANELYNENGYE